MPQKINDQTLSAPVVRPIEPYSVDPRGTQTQTSGQDRQATEPFQERETVMPSTQQWVELLDPGLDWGLIGKQAADFGATLYDYAVKKRMQQRQDDLKDAQLDLIQNLERLDLEASAAASGQAPSGYNSPKEFFDVYQQQVSSLVTGYVGRAESIIGAKAREDGTTAHTAEYDPSDMHAFERNLLLDSRSFLDQTRSKVNVGFNEARKEYAKVEQKIQDEQRYWNGHMTPEEGRSWAEENLIPLYNRVKSGDAEAFSILMANSPVKLSPDQYTNEDGTLKDSVAGNPVLMAGIAQTFLHNGLYLPPQTLQQDITAFAQGRFQGTAFSRALVRSTLNLMSDVQVQNMSGTDTSRLQVGLARQAVKRGMPDTEVLRYVNRLDEGRIYFLNRAMTNVTTGARNFGSATVANTYADLLADTKDGIFGDIGEPELVFTDPRLRLLALEAEAVRQSDPRNISEKDALNLVMAQSAYSGMLILPGPGAPRTVQVGNALSSEIANMRLTLSSPDSGYPSTHQVLLRKRGEQLVEVTPEVFRELSYADQMQVSLNTIAKEGIYTWYQPQTLDEFDRQFTAVENLVSQQVAESGNHPDAPQLIFELSFGDQFPTSDEDVRPFSKEDVFLTTLATHPVVIGKVQQLVRFPLDPKILEKVASFQPLSDSERASWKNAAEKTRKVLLESYAEFSVPLAMSEVEMINLDRNIPLDLVALTINTRNGNFNILSDIPIPIVPGWTSK